MIREFSAIGLSKYTGQQAAGALINKIMSTGNLKGRHYKLGEKVCMELAYNMGPFQLILRGERKNQRELVIESATPVLKEKRGYLIGDTDVFVGEKGLLYLEGSDLESMETMTLCLTEIAKCYQDPDIVKKSPLMVSCYGISTEGKVLLGIERSAEEIKNLKEETEKRRQMLRAAREGNDSAQWKARKSIRQDEFESEEEVVERLKEEDVYSIYDGFYYPSEKDENCFTILGDITHIDKLMNPLSEEWVYYLDLDVMGQLLRVLINPIDLVGQPDVGRRFQGKVRFYGRLDPARLIFEDQSGFF